MEDWEELGAISMMFACFRKSYDGEWHWHACMDAMLNLDLPFCFQRAKLMDSGKRKLSLHF